MSSSGMHSTVAMPNETAEEAKELWEKQTNPDLNSTQKMLQTINFKLGKWDDENRSFQAIASTPMVDRQGDSIEQAGWVLDNFIKNPVIPWAHLYYELPVARATEIGIVDGNLTMTVQFPAEGIYDFADTVWQMYRNQFMFAFSVGFIPLEYEGNWEDGYNFTKCELLEVSAVPVPANAGALVLSQKMGFMDEKQAKQMIDKVEAALKNLKENMVKKTIAKKVEEKPLTLKDIREVMKELIAEKDTDEDEKAKGLTNNTVIVQTDNMTEQKSGASISAANKEKIKAVLAGLDKAMEDMKVHHKALADLADVGADSEDDAQNDDPNDEKSVESNETSKPKAKKADEVEAEVKLADDESDNGAEQTEDENKGEETETEEDTEKVVPPVVEAEVEVPAVSEEETEDKTPESEEKSVEDLVDVDDLSDEDIAKIVAAVQSELDKEDQ